VPRPRRLHPGRLALAATLAAAILYGGLFFGQRMGTSEFDRVAALDAGAASYEGLRLRSADGTVDPAANRYAEALERLAESRTSTLGLFPRYRQEGLAETKALLDEVVRLEGPGAALGLEARFLRAKIFLYTGERDAAREELRIVVERQGPSAPDARRLLEGMGQQ
jgi:hypothetical protein